MTARIIIEVSITEGKNVSIVRKTEFDEHPSAIGGYLEATYAIIIYNLINMFLPIFGKSDKTEK